MKNTHKRMLGFFGLSVVATMTVVAATMPTPGVSATASPSAVDTLTVRVLNNVPTAEITSPVNGVTVTKPIQHVTVNYEKLKEVTVYIKYIDEDGHESAEHIFFHQAGLDPAEPGTIDQNYTLGSGGFGYGRYVFSVVGVDEEDGTLPLDSVVVDFTPVNAEAEQNENDGMVEVRFTDYQDDVEEIEIWLDGKLIKTVPKEDLDKVQKLSFEDKDSGTYTLELKAKYADGSSARMPDIDVDFDAGFVPHTDVPDTGRFFRNLNIASEDYLVTGLIVFFVLGIVAFGIVTRSKRSTNLRRKRH